MQETPEKIREILTQRVSEIKYKNKRKGKKMSARDINKDISNMLDKLRKVYQEVKQLKLAYERNLKLVSKHAELKLR